MKIIDLNGAIVEVGNLELAIGQADSFRQYRVDNPLPSDYERYAYWEDIYQKLLKLQTHEP